MTNIERIKLLCISVFGLFALHSCADKDDYMPSLPNGTIVVESGLNAIAQGDTLVLTAEIESLSESTFYWSVDGKKVSDETVFLFFTEELGLHQIKLNIENTDGSSDDAIEVEVYGKYRFGTFVLNEGNMTSGNGSLIFISPQGYITEKAYYEANGTNLGSTSQDLFISGERIYIVSQNGNKSGGDGILVVADSETLVKKAAYQEELETLSWPSHVATLGTDDVYIRDNAGVHLFNTSSKDLILVKGTERALKNRMAVVKDKVFVPFQNSVKVIEQGKDSISYSIDFGANVTGVIKSSDNNIWVSTSGFPSKINKIDASDYSVIKTNEISEINLGAGWGATPAISAVGDTLYFSNANTTIYRHIFASNTTLKMTNVKDHVENANIVYNNLAVHPKSGQVYINTIKGYGMDYLINDISVFDFGQEAGGLVKKYKDYTDFPAGIFFTYDYE
ncbi:DUF5074 domain-containing protein [Belliella marina]|uniref:DUF5074 domain-containing protein n=1 Tax=Belliella marina TaxID=1644146 RepID=A0ABW4VMT4_9BACT